MYSTVMYLKKKEKKKKKKRIKIDVVGNICMVIMS